MPTKEQRRKWLDNTIKSKKPPPSPKQIRKELGWDIEQAIQNKARRL